MPTEAEWQRAAIGERGQEYATFHQAKETLGQRRLDLDTARDAVQSNVTQAWAALAEPLC